MQTLKLHKSALNHPHSGLSCGLVIHTYKRSAKQNEKDMTQNNPAHADHPNAIDRGDCRSGDVCIEDLSCVTEQRETEEHFADLCYIMQ